MKEKWNQFAVLAVAVFAVFGQAIGFDFLRFDDPDYTFANPFVRSGLDPVGIYRAFVDFRHGAVWMPMTWISYMLDISLFGRGAAGHHLVNVLLHIVNCWLLLKLCLLIAGPSDYDCGAAGVCALPVRKPSQSALPVWRSSQSAAQFSPTFKSWLLVVAVAFWALHPQRVEVVAWVASRKELLWTMFTLSGLMFWWHGRRWFAYGCCALACMSKPTAMVFPLLVLLLDFRHLQNALKSLKPLGSLKSLRPLKTLKPLSYLPLVLLAMATGVAAIYSQTHPEGMAAKDLFYAGFGERLLNAIVAVGLYLGQMVVSIGIHLDYRAVPGGWPLNGAWAIAMLVLVALAVMGLVRRGVKLGSVFWIPLIWFLLALLPTLGLFASFGEHARADRFLYLPAMALPLAVAKAMRHLGGMEVERFASKLPEKWWRRLTAPAAKWFAVLLLFAFCVQTWRIVSTYRNDATAFERTLACDPDHGRALAHVGEAKCAAGNFDEGIKLLRHSREVRPREATDGKLAYALMSRGRAEDWREIVEVCAPFVANPARDLKGQALEALGTAELRTREWQKAAEHLSRSILAPARFYSADDAKLKLAYAWHNGGRRDDARKLLEAIAKSTRADLAGRAERALEIIERSPTAILFW